MVTPLVLVAKKQNRLLVLLLCSAVQLGYAQLPATYPFPECDTANAPIVPKLPANFSYKILFQEGNPVINPQTGKTGKAKRNHDYLSFITVDSVGGNKGLVYVSHETNDTSNALGDGGGGTVFQIVKSKKDNSWSVDGKFQNIDFSPVGGTYNNCSGTITPQKRILTAEEFPPESNSELYSKGRGFRDTTDFAGLKRHQSMGWMVEVDPFAKKALQKLSSMGRYSHEGIWIMPDSQTVFLADDFAPAVFFKFVADVPGNFVKGQLFAFKQNTNGLLPGEWIALPRDLDSLVYARDMAIKRGATLFLRLEWMTLVDNKLFITETGSDSISLQKNIMLGGVPAHHLEQYKLQNTAGDYYDYPYGSVLSFDVYQNTMYQHLAGGSMANNPLKHFSNPDGIAQFSKDGKTYLVISEDVIRTDRGRCSKYAEDNRLNLNEVFLLDASVPVPRVHDLHRIMVAPLGCETTGAYFSPDAKTLFINIQHPSEKNPPPFNKSTTIAISGF